METEPLVLGALPDEILSWRGTAAELAEQCNALLPRIGLAEDAAANERLIRHYVQVGVLAPPEREGREALFGARHIREFLAARYLLKDGWSLAKIAELIRAAGPEGLTRFVPGERVPTRAEAALDRLRLRRPDVQRDEKPAARHLRPHAHLDVNTLSAPFERGVQPSMAPPPDTIAESWEAVPATAEPTATYAAAEPLLQAAEISRRRMDLQAGLSSLGNTTGEVGRRRTLQITLTPWCQVYVDLAELERLPADTPELIGNALTQALHEERIRRGEKT